MSQDDVLSESLHLKVRSLPSFGKDQSFLADTSGDVNNGAKVNGIVCTGYGPQSGLTFILDTPAPGGVRSTPIGPKGVTKSLSQLLIGERFMAQGASNVLLSDNPQKDAQVRLKIQTPWTFVGFNDGEDEDDVEEEAESESAEKVEDDGVEEARDEKEGEDESSGWDEDDGGSDSDSDNDNDGDRVSGLPLPQQRPPPPRPLQANENDGKVQRDDKRRHPRGTDDEVEAPVGETSGGKRKDELHRLHCRHDYKRFKASTIHAEHSERPIFINIKGGVANIYILHGSDDDSESSKQKRGKQGQHKSSGKVVEDDDDDDEDEDYVCEEEASEGDKEEYSIVDEDENLDSDELGVSDEEEKNWSGEEEEEEKKKEEEVKDSSVQNSLNPLKL
ncbi:hypothetical protein BGW39_007391 [Mortierella sp. 14UC]|nr:hypothetical protein BGW39_007391 [Mortierella sp. 14UC]